MAKDLKKMTTETMQPGEEIPIWGAVGPDGTLVKSSIGTFRAVAERWAIRRGNYEVVKLGTVHPPRTDVLPVKRPRGRPRKEDTVRR